MKTIRVAFPLIDGSLWRGGYYYLLNLLQAITTYEPGITPILLLGSTVPEADRLPFRNIHGLEIATAPELDRIPKFRALLARLLFGRDTVLQRKFGSQRVDVLFEFTQFFGWRLSCPAITWIPDFQHRRIPDMFTRAGYLRRELGFRLLLWSGRQIMLSSEDAKRDFETFYGNTRHYPPHVVRFAVRAKSLERTAARAVAHKYGLPDKFFYLPNQFWRHKRHDVVLHALRHCRDHGCPVVVAACGRETDTRDPGYIGWLRAQIKLHNLEPYFRILGEIPRADLYALMVACDALINPSDMEGWSTTVEEAKALGAPMILSDLAVHREQTNDHARYFARGDSDALAHALMGFDPLPEDARVEATRMAVQRSDEAVRQFARDFAQAVMDTADGRKRS